MLITASKNKKKDYLISYTKSAGIIKEFIDRNFYLLLNGKIAQDI